MDNSKEKSLMTKCECSSEALEFQYWPEDKQFYVAFWQQGFHRPLCFRERVRWAWRLLFTGNPWGDMIILSPEKAKEIADFINQNL